ncbi:12102_t:CDS:2 [Rhizophagus irregularis]|nr:12102_t:CDS:2 [Rhizophagus irregularis]
MHGARGSAVIADLTIEEICLIYPKFGRGTKESFIFTLGDGTSPYDARISRIAYDNCDTEIDDLIWIGPKFGKGPDLWVRMNADQSGEARKGTYESSILETEGRFRWIECEIFSLMKK